MKKFVTLIAWHILYMIVPLYKAKEERTECKNYRDIRLLSIVGKIYTGI